MIYYTVFTIYDVIKSLFGYKPSGTAVRMVPNATVTTSPEAITQPIPSTSRAAQNFDADRRSLNGDWQSIHSVASATSSVMGNGASKKFGQAVLRGSPKALGWTIDETEEENAWVLIMQDAIHGSIHEVAAADEDVITSPIAPSNQDIIRFFASKEEPGVSYVWRIVPSLTGAHQWTLHREAEAQPVQEVLEPEVIRAEMQVDTEDLVQSSHQEVEIQTVTKSYSDAGVQAEEPEPAVPVGALSPLPETTDLVDVLPADLRPVTPGAIELEDTVIDSRPGTPNSQSRIPRLISRRGSVASFQTSSTRSASPVPRGASPIPVPATQKLIRQATGSIRSMALRRASSKASMNPSLTDARDVDVVEKKKSGGRLFDAVKRIGRADSTVKSWRP